MSDSVAGDIFEIFVYLAFLGGVAFVVLGIIGGVTGVGSPVVIIKQGDAGQGYNFITGNWYEDKVYGPGVTCIWPWTKVEEYNVAVQKQTSQNDFPTADGGKITVISSISYGADKNSIAELEMRYKGNYFENYLHPAWISAEREVIVSKDLSYFISHQDDTDEIELLIKEKLESDCRDRGIYLESVYVEVLLPPEGVTNAVNMREELNASGNNSDLVGTYKIATSGNNKIVVANT